MRPPSLAVMLRTGRYPRPSVHANDVAYLAGARRRHQASLPEGRRSERQRAIRAANPAAVGA